MDQRTQFMRQVLIAKQGFSPDPCDPTHSSWQILIIQILSACFDHTIADKERYKQKDDPKNEEWLEG